MLREFRPAYIRDNATALCWTAANPNVVNTSFSLQTCATSRPPPANQFFMSVMKYSSISRQRDWPDNKAMTVLGSSLRGTEWNSVRNPNSLCLNIPQEQSVDCDVWEQRHLQFGLCFGKDLLWP